MLRPGGYAVTTSARGQREADTFTCVHCNSVVILVRGGDPSSYGGWCGMCAKHICGKCVDAGKCVPFEKRLEQMEARGRLPGAI